MNVKPLSPDVMEKILNQMEAVLGKWERRGYCPCCISRNLLMSAGLVAAHVISPDDMGEALGYIATLSERHAPAISDAHS
jgi:hypothetical protein